MSLKREIELALNRHSAENGSDTPDFILAELLMDVLKTWDKCTVMRQRWSANAPPAEEKVAP